MNHEQETIDRGMLKLWMGTGFFLYAQYAKPKRLKFFLVNAFTGEYQVKHKENIVF